MHGKNYASYLGEIKHFKRQKFNKLCKLYMQFIDWPFNEFDFKLSADNP